MKVITAAAPSLADIIREQLDAVSSLRIAKIGKADHALVSKYLLGDEDLSPQDAALAEVIGTSLLLRWLIGESGKLIAIDSELGHLVRENLSPSKAQYEEYLAYEFAGDLENMARRARTVYVHWIKHPPSSTVARLCRESCQTYVSGYHSASVALLRAVVEASIRAKLRIDTGTLGPLNDEGLKRKLYDRRMWNRVETLKRYGNNLLHRGSIPTEEQNLIAIKHAQATLTALHSS